MIKAVVPYNSLDLDIFKTSPGFHKKKFIKRRNDLLNELRCVTGIPEIAKELSPNAVYKLVSKPEGAKLFKDSCGNVKGVFYKDGKIVEHARFQTIKPSLIKASSVVGSQILLVSIAMQLNRIEKGISRIINELHNDRISEILAGVELFNQALVVTNSDTQSRIIENAIQTLNVGVKKTVRSLKTQIEDAPSLKMGFWDDWGSNRTATATQKFALSEESFKACLLGVKTIFECYATINESEAAALALKTILSDLKSSGIEMAVQKARLVPAQGGKYPEEPWLSFLNHESLFVNALDQCKCLATGEFESIEIELKPKELIGGCNGK